MKMKFAAGIIASTLSLSAAFEAPAQASGLNDLSRTLRDASRIMRDFDDLSRNSQRLMDRNNRRYERERYYNRQRDYYQPPREYICSDRYGNRYVSERRCPR